MSAYAKCAGTGATICSNCLRRLVPESSFPARQVWVAFEPEADTSCSMFIPWKADAPSRKAKKKDDAS